MVMNARQKNINQTKIFFDLFQFSFSSLRFSKLNYYQYFVSCFYLYNLHILPRVATCE